MLSSYHSILSRIPNPSNPLIWLSFSLSQVIDYEGRGGVRVHTQTGRDTVSHLLVKEAGPGDSGRYTCSPSNGEPATVMLHVLNGECCEWCRVVRVKNARTRHEMSDKGNVVRCDAADAEM